MKVIYKYTLPQGNGITTSIPDGKVRAIMNQDGIPSIWIEHNTDQYQISYALITCIGTGTVFNINDVGIYIGSLQDGPFIWHYYMRDQ